MTIPIELAGIPPAIMVVLRMLKATGLPTKFFSLVALVLGIVAAIVLDVGGAFINNIIFGIMAGGSASGLYEAGKAINKIGK